MIRVRAEAERSIKSAAASTLNQNIIKLHCEHPDRKLSGHRVHSAVFIYRIVV